MLPSRLQAPLILGIILLSSAPAIAHADDEPSTRRFGDQGQAALHLNDGLTASEGDLTSGPQVQLDYFVADRVSLGLMLGANWYSTSVVDNTSTHNFVFRVGPRLGYDVPLSAYVSFWPQIGVDYHSNHATNNDTGFATSGPTSTSSTSSAFGITLVAPLLMHPTPGFFIGAGPSLYTEISNSISAGAFSGDNSKVTAVGLMATIGGAI